MISTADAGPTRILARLCRHWSLTFAAAYGDTQDHIEPPLGPCLLSACAATRTLHLECAAEADRFEQIVAEHARRMARGETQHWNWQRQAG